MCKRRRMAVVLNHKSILYRDAAQGRLNRYERDAVLLRERFECDGETRRESTLCRRDRREVLLRPQNQEEPLAIPTCLIVHDQEPRPISAHAVEMGIQNPLRVYLRTSPTFSDTKDEAVLTGLDQ